MEKYRKFRRAVDRLLVWEKYYCVATMLIMLVLAFCQVVLRYVFNKPWSWSDEIILMVLAWFSYPAIMFNVWNDNHFHISSVYDKFPPALKKAADITRHILMGVFLAMMGYYGLKLTQQYWPKPMPASGWSQGLKFIPVMAGGILSAFFCLVNLIGVLIGADRPEKGGNA